MMSDVLAT